MDTINWHELRDRMRACSPEEYRQNIERIVREAMPVTPTPAPEAFAVLAPKVHAYVKKTFGHWPVSHDPLTNVNPRWMGHVKEWSPQLIDWAVERIVGDTVKLRENLERVVSSVDRAVPDGVISPANFHRVIAQIVADGTDDTYDDRWFGAAEEALAILVQVLGITNPPYLSAIFDRHFQSWISPSETAEKAVVEDLEKALVLELFAQQYPR